MHLATLFTLPLLASAVAAVPTVQTWGNNNGQQVPMTAHDSDIKIDIDLKDLRLVQFADDEAPTYVLLARTLL